MYSIYITIVKRNDTHLICNTRAKKIRSKFDYTLRGGGGGGLGLCLYILWALGSYFDTQAVVVGAIPKSLESGGIKLSKLNM